MNHLTGRYGYNKNFPGNGGGINTKQLDNYTNEVEDILRRTAKNAKQLLSQNKTKEAYDLVMNSIANADQKARFIELYFPACLTE